MSDPVAASGAAPLFGGTAGVRRPVLGGKPTSVPTGLPSFRGRPNAPGDAVRAPAIQTKNRQNRGSNVTIPYSRIVPLDHLRNVGRVGAGDIVFCSRFTSSGIGFNQARPVRIVGVDWLNQQLGGRPEYDDGKFAENWAVGHNVLLGSPVDLDAAPIDADTVADARNELVADEWRSCELLREWAIDGVVLSADEHCFENNGQRDGQLFNIAVQGLAATNNGYSTPALPVALPTHPTHPTPVPSLARRRLQGRRRRGAAPRRAHRSCRLS